jgi:hypothetical protein
MPAVNIGWIEHENIDGAVSIRELTKVGLERKAWTKLLDVTLTFDMATELAAQNANDVLRLFGGLAQGTIPHGVNGLTPDVAREYNIKVVLMMPLPGTTNLHPHQFPRRFREEFL